MTVDPNVDHNYRGIKDIQKIISMLEEMVIKPEYDASIGVGPGDYAFGDIRITSNCVQEFVELLRSISPEHDACVRNATLTDLKDDFFKYVHPDSDAGKVMKTLIKHRITEQP